MIPQNDYEAQLGFDVGTRFNLDVGQACNQPMYNQVMNEQSLSNRQQFNNPQQPIQQCSANLSNQQFQGLGGVGSVNNERPHPEASTFFQQKLRLNDYEAQLGFGVGTTSNHDVGQACNQPMYNQMMNEQRLSNMQQINNPQQPIQQSSANLSNQQFQGLGGVGSFNNGRPHPEASTFFQQKLLLNDYEAQLGFGVGTRSNLDVGQACNQPMYNQMMNEQRLSNRQQFNNPQQPIQQSSANLSNQQFEGLGGVGSVNNGHPHPEASMLFQQQLHKSLLRSPFVAAQAHTNTLQHDQHLRARNMNRRPLVKLVSKFDICLKLVTKYIHDRNCRPKDNNIEHWRKVVAENFAPNAKKKWCVALYGKGQQTAGLSSQDECVCNLCNHKSSWSFEATYEILPRLFKVKYDSGILDEHLYLDWPEHYYPSGGQTVLIYSKVVQRTVFKQFHVTRYGQLRVVFSRGFKISSWEFCSASHEEVVPRSLLVRPVADITQECEALTQNTNLSISELQSKSAQLVESTKAIAKEMEGPLLNEFGYTKSFVKCLQLADVVNSMKDLMDITIATGAGPMESWDTFNSRMNSWSGWGQNANEGNNHESRKRRLV